LVNRDFQLRVKNCLPTIRVPLQKVNSIRISNNKPKADLTGIGNEVKGSINKHPKNIVDSPSSISPNGFESLTLLLKLIKFVVI
jgi:hypothetical protein